MHRMIIFPPSEDCNRSALHPYNLTPPFLGSSLVGRSFARCLASASASHNEQVRSWTIRTCCAVSQGLSGSYNTMSFGCKDRTDPYKYKAYAKHVGGSVPGIKYRVVREKGAMTDSDRVTENLPFASSECPPKCANTRYHNSTHAVTPHSSSFLWHTIVQRWSPYQFDAP